jgi:hypothetical protein
VSMYSRHEEYVGVIEAPPARVFEHLDDQIRLSAHMSKRSWKMGWGRMDTILDDERGQAVGSHIVLRGRVFGIRLYLDEVVTTREVPHRKRWETIGEPSLLVIGAYRMGFNLDAHGAQASALRVAIDYELPRRGLSSVLGKLLGRTYAKWCTRRMVEDAQRAFRTVSGNS